MQATGYEEDGGERMYACMYVGSGERDETTGAEMKRLWREMTAKHQA